MKKHELTIWLIVALLACFIGYADAGMWHSENAEITGGAVTDNSVVRGDGGASGMQDSGVLIDDSDNVTGVTTLTVDGAGESSFVGPVTMALSHITKTADATLTAAECKNTVINNVGQSAEMTLTLPTAAEGLTFLYEISTAAQTSHVKAGATDKIYLDKEPLDDADKVSNNGASSEVLDSIRFSTFESGSGAWDWRVDTLHGTWSDGGS